jgi:uncharacterized paraquat-inducible protein A
VFLEALMVAGQIAIDFDYDERVVRLSREIAVMVSPHAAPGIKSETVKVLAERVAKLAYQRLRDAWEPTEDIRCHTCDEMTTPKNRVRVAVCARCSHEGRSVGSGG